MFTNEKPLEVRIDQRELEALEDLPRAGEFLEMATSFGYGYYIDEEILSGKITGVTSPDRIVSEAKKIFILVQVDLRYADEHKSRGLLN